MIRFTSGNLLDASAEALVNTVNEVGVMGKGIALMFRERFPANTSAYTEASKAGGVRVGQMLVTETGELFPRWIINFPTKKHWRNPSKLEWVRTGLQDLLRVIRELGIRSIALPPLGCGNGGLAWTQVRPMIEAAMSEVADVDVLVYEPTATYQNAPKPAGLQKLTPARALIAEMVRRYSVLGLDCTILEVQKLAYFLQEAVTGLGVPDEQLRLTFTANKYGPYSDQLRHLLDGLDGSYLHAERRISDTSPMNLISFDSAKRETVAAYLVTPEAAPYLPALEATSALIEGFESPTSMELLATVHWLLHKRSAEPNVASLRAGLAEWPAGEDAAKRKLALFDEWLLQLALDRLTLAI